MQIDNPFLTLELRRHRRQKVWVLLSLGGALLALPLLVVAVLGFFPWYQELTLSPFRWVVFGLTATLGAVAGGYAGSRIFLAERRAGLMESLRLLPLSSARWLTAKLGFPLLFLLLAAWMALPAYLIAAVLDLLPANQALWEWVLPLGVGLGMIAVQLLGSGGSQNDAPLPQNTPVHLLPRRERLERFRQMSLTLPLQLLLGQTAFLLFLGRGGMFIPRPFYLTTAPRWLLLAALIAILFVTAWTTALASLSGTELAERRAGYVRWAAVAITLVILVGITWGRGTTRLIMLGSLAVPALIFMVWGQVGMQLKRREDRFAEPELAWLERRWDNALFLRDLRAHTRSRSLRGSVLLSLLVAVIVVGVVVVAATWGSKIAWRGGWGFLIQFFAQLIIQPLVNMLARARTLWQQDFQRGRLELLSLTPIATTDLVRGRAAASIVAHFATSWGALMAVPAGLVWLALAGFGGTLLPALTLIGTIVALNLGSGALAQLQITNPDLVKPYRTRRYRLGLAQFTVGVVAVGLVALGIYGHWQPVWAWVGSCGALLVLPCSLWVAKALFRLRVEELDLFRAGEATWTGATNIAKEK